MAGAVIGQRIQRISTCIDYTAQHLRPDANGRTRAPRYNLIAIANSLGLIGGHCQHRGLPEADDFAGIALATTDNFARLSNRAVGSVRFNQIPYHLIHTSVPPQGRTGAEKVRVWRKQSAAHSLAGLTASRSKKPCSTSFNCFSKLKFAEPSSVSTMQSWSFN